MARASRAESERTAAAVLSTAARMFAELGFGGVALEEVAAAAGVTRGAVYHHYGSKAGLFRAVHARTQEDVGTHVLAAVDGIDEPWRALEAGCRAWLSAALRPDVRRIVLLDAPAVLGWQAWREADAAHSGRLLHDGLRELHDGGELRVVSVGAAHALLSGGMNEAALWIAGSDDPDAALEEAWRTLRMLIGALRRSGS